MDSTDWVALTEQKTWERFERNQERAERNAGHGDNPVSLELATSCLPLLMELITVKLEDIQGTLRALKAPELRSFLITLKNLPPEVIGLCALQGVLHGVGAGAPLLNMTLALGQDIQGELFAAKLLQGEEGLRERIEKAVRKKHARLATRRLSATAIAKKAGYGTRSWSKGSLLRAGNVLVAWTLEACPHVFCVNDGKRGIKYIAVQEVALELAMHEVQQAVLSRPANLPCTQPPIPWSGLHTGGYPDERLKGRGGILRKASKAQQSAARAGIASGAMRPVLDSINALQAVPWRINTRVLAVLTECIERKINVKGLPRAKPYAKPEVPEDADEGKQLAWKRRCSKIEEQNRALVTDRVLLAEDVAVARLLEGEQRFWTPYNADWRGRVYPLPSFNFQRDDRVRALFLFAEGAAIGTEGLYWLKVHLANTGDFDKISKRPLKERVQWVDQHQEGLENIASDPLKHRDWMLADKPFLFLAACLELFTALAEGPAFVTHLPVSWDGSCSGLQHLCAMTRAPEGSLVNLTPSLMPQDVYATVAVRVTERVQEDANGADPNKAAVAKLCLAYGIDRKVVKRSVMTFCYASKKFGMAMQFREDLMRPLEVKVLAGELDAHPFGDDNGRAAQTYLAQHVFMAICEIVTLPAEAMGFLQSCARALAHEGKTVRWTTPAGLPVFNAYYEPTFSRVRLWLHDASVTLKLATGDTKLVDKDKAANGIAPNFVHSMDAAHLMLTTCASVAEGITNIATVHDSFGCLAPQATRFNQIIREQFVQMYERNDVLTQVLDTATADLTEHNQHRLPDAVAKGSLNINEVKDAVYAFA